MRATSRPDNHFIETPRGIFTSAGNWFHFTTDAMDRFAPGLLEKHSMEKLIKNAEVWIRSADNIGIALFMLLLYAQGLWMAVFITLIFVPVWHIFKAGFISISLTHILNIVDKEIFVVLLSFVVLSWMGVTEQYYSVFLGIIFFCVLKFGWFRGAVEWFYELISSTTLLLNDRVLKMIIIRYAIKEGIPVRETEAMENEILSLISKQKEVLKKFKKRK